MSELITADLVALDSHFGDTKDDVIKGLAQLVADSDRSDDAIGLADDAFAREAKSSTGMPGGLAIPHCRSEHVSESTLAFARLSPSVDFGAKDGPADLVFLIAAPASGDQEHMRLLTKLARALVRKDFTDGLRSATSNDEVVQLVSDVVSDPPAAETDPANVETTAPNAAPAAPNAATGSSTQPSEPPADGDGTSTSSAAPAASPAQSATRPAGPASGTDMTIVVVTACPTGIAHTYMAAEALEAAGRKAGVDLVVEPQGSVGAEAIDPAVIASASAAIFATDVGVRNRERFAGLPEISTGVKQGIHEADALVARAIAAASDPNASRVSGSAASASGTPSGPSSDGQSVLIKTRTALLTGVSYMIPFVAAGGLLIALGFLFGG